MIVPIIHSIAPVSKVYNTGERPILVTCSDNNDYICKYTLSSGSAFKLVCELIGNSMASLWGLNNPEFALITLSAEHQQNVAITNRGNKLCLGSRFMENVVDLTKVSLLAVNDSFDNFCQLLDIALFDMWMANEDRNANNFNLMINIDDERFVPIDFGCIFNSSTFEYPLSQLTMSDSLMYSDLFCSMARKYADMLTEDLLNKIHASFVSKVAYCNDNNTLLSIPTEWLIPQELVSRKLYELFSPQWIDSVWENYTDILNNSITIE